MSETSDITAPLLKALRKAGVMAHRMQSGKVKVRGGWMSLCEQGTADILCFPSRKPPTWLETKVASGKASDSQTDFADRVRSMGHRHFVVRSVEEGLDAVL